MMRLIFCADPLNPRQPDSAYAQEFAAAERLGIDYSLINFEGLADDAEAAVRRVAPAPEDGEIGVYRGWMITPPQYGAPFDALADRRVALVNAPEQYEHCHYLPRWYKTLAGHTPRSVWTQADGTSLPRLMVLLKDFNDHPVIVRDFVKSRKHEWLDACFIPSAADADIPAAEPYPVLSFEDFVRETESAWTDGFLIARRGDEYIGLSCLSCSNVDVLELNQAITGVRADWRYQGVATALKARGIQLARDSGYARIITYVDSTNVPMAALNQKLGFVGGKDAVLMERRDSGM